MMKPFDYYEPRNLQEAVELLQRFGPRCQILAGGTDLLVKMKRHLLCPDVVISIHHLDELRYIRDQGDSIEIGALATVDQILKAASIQEACPALGQAARVLGSTQIRTLATVGGNLCNAAPSADLAPPLLAHGCAVTVAGPNGVRDLPLEQFFRGPGQTALCWDELLVSLRVDKLAGGSACTYLKHSRRRLMDIAVAGVAVFVRIGKEGRAVNARIALGAVGPVPFRAVEAENALTGQKLDPLLRSVGLLRTLRVRVNPFPM